MTLDDRSLREHLDRRATAGAVDPESIADAVIERVGATGHIPWWQRVLDRGGAPARGLVAAAAVLAVLVVAVGLAPRWLGNEPGTSPDGSGSPVPSTLYPAERPLTAAELAELLGSDPTRLAAVTVIADVELVEVASACFGGECPTYRIDVPGGELFVHHAAEIGPLIPGPQAFRVRSDGHLDLVGPVRPGPDGLAWTLPQLLAILPETRAADRAVPYLHLVGAATAFLPPPPCPTSSGAPFGCGRAQWLVEDDDAVGRDGLAGRPGIGLRIPNDAETSAPDDGSITGFFLVRPTSADNCFLCTDAGPFDFLGRVPTLDELGVDALGPTTGPTIEPSPTDPQPVFTAGQIWVMGIELSTTSISLDGWETADVEVRVTFGGEVVEVGQMDLSTTPLVCLEREEPRTGSEVTQLVNDLELVPGTTTWVGSYRFTASHAGTWHATCLQAYDAHGNALSDDLIGVNPFDLGFSPELTVEGSHRPGITMAFEPSPAIVGRALEVYGFVTDDTGATYEGVEVTIGRDNVCAEGGGGEIVATDANGRYSYVIPEADAYAVCAWLLEIPGATSMPFLDMPPNALYGGTFAHPTEP